MYTKLRLLMIVILSSILFYSCSEDPTSAGLSNLNNDDLISVSLDSSFVTSNKVFTTSVSFSGASTLLLGKYNNLNSTLLMQFDFSSIFDSVKTGFLNNSVTVTQATVEMIPSYTIGSKAAALDFDIDEIKSGWPAGSNFGPDSLRLLQGVPVTKSAKNFTDTLYSFDLDNQTVLSWLKDTTKTSRALKLKPKTEINRMVGFQALNGVTGNSSTKIRVVIQKTGQYIDTLTFYLNKYLHLVQGSTPASLPQDRIVVQGGIGLHSMIRFDFPKIPEGSIINSALLQLTLDSLTSFTGTPKAQSLVVLRLTDTTNYSYDSTKAVSLNLSGNVYSGDISVILQRWVLGQPNLGMAVAIATEKGTADLISLMGSGQAERPRLKIVYTAKKP